jgi:Leucine-rich repeat (LRR) protein
MSTASQRKSGTDAGRLSNKGIAELPPLLPWPEGLTLIDLGGNQIVDVSALTLPDGLTELGLICNQIVDVSALTLPDGLTMLYLYNNQIVDVSALTLPDGCDCDWMPDDEDEDEDNDDAIEGTLTVFLEKYGISKEEWDAGRLSHQGIAEPPPLLPWPEGLMLSFCVHDGVTLACFCRNSTLSSLQSSSCGATRRMSCGVGASAPLH